MQRENIPQPIPNSPITQTDFGYTGRRNITGMGLMDYRARFYDSTLMRFIQPDTIIPNPADAQGWNGYSYVSNNPLLFVDPTGHFGKHNDDKSDYWNRRNQEKVKVLESEWESEKAANASEQLLQAATKETALDPITGFWSPLPALEVASRSSATSVARDHRSRNG